MYITPFNGQSNYDICLQGYGGLDLLVKMCKDNNVTDIDIVQKIPYLIDENKIIDLNSIGFKYKTLSR